MHPLSFAAREGHINDVIRLIDVDKVDVDIRDNHSGLTPLFFATINNNIEIVVKLINSGADINLQDHRDGWTPLHHAVFNHRIDIVKLLLINGANVNMIDNYECTPLHVAVCYDKNVIEILLEYGADKTITNIAGKIPAELTEDHNIHQLFDRYNLDIKEPDI